MQPPLAQVELVAGLVNKLVGTPLAAADAGPAAEMAGFLLGDLAALRRLPLGDVLPAAVYEPGEP